MMDDVLCGECKNHYRRGGWNCWSGNKALGFCRQNEEPHPKAKYWNYGYKNGKVVEFRDIVGIAGKGGVNDG